MTIANATGLDITSGVLLGPWQTSVETERNTYEALYAVENSLSRRIAADLCGLDNEGDLFKKPPGGNASAGEHYRYPFSLRLVK